MARRHLRVYPSDDVATAELPDATVRIRLGDLLPLVAMAQRLHFVWLQDFLDDEVRITRDLADVLKAFKSCRPSA